MSDGAGMGECGMHRAVFGQECDAVVDFVGGEVMSHHADVHVNGLKDLRMGSLLDGRHITAVVVDDLPLALVHAVECDEGTFTECSNERVHGRVPYLRIKVEPCVDDVPMHRDGHGVGRVCTGVECRTIHENYA